MKSVFESHENFSATSAIAKRITRSLDFLQSAFAGKGESLRTRTVVQSLITLTCKLVSTDGCGGKEKELQQFFVAFLEALTHQIELGQAATDSDYLTFQRSVNANVKGGAKTRHEILLRKLFQLSPALAQIFDSSIVAESGVSGRITELGDSITQLIQQINHKYQAQHGDDLFKATNKTSPALLKIRKPIRSDSDYAALIDNLYFLFRESVGTRIGEAWPQSFSDVNTLRTDLRHDTDHGEASKVKAKRKKFGKVFERYGGVATPETMDPAHLPLVHSNLLGAIEGDLRVLLTRDFSTTGAPSA
jgi:hypothetical protein